MYKRLSVTIAFLVILSLLLTGVVAAAGEIQTAADAYFSGGTQNIRAADLFDTLNDGDPSNDPFIIDARLAADYELAHIPGAVNIGAKAAFTPDTLATIPADQAVVVYCYTGQTSSQMASALNMLGYDAKSLLFGFPSWAIVDGLQGQAPFDPAVDQHDYRVSTEATTVEADQAAPEPLGDTIAAAAEAYFSNGTKNIKSSDLFDNLNDGDASNDPFVLDVRRAEDYETAHVPGAVHSAPTAALSEATLAMIPADVQVVVYCYTGQTASQVTSALNMLGYDAYNMKFGFASWSPQGTYSFDPATTPNYRYEGTGPAETAETTAEMAETSEAPATEMAESAAEAPAETAMETPAALPATGGVLINIFWLLLTGSSLLGTGLYLRRK